MAAARRGVPRFVYPSSGAIYGAAARDVPLIDEDTVAPTPVTLYGLTKRAAETLLPRVAETQGVALRRGASRQRVWPVGIRHGRARHAIADASGAGVCAARRRGGAGAGLARRLHLLARCGGRPGAAGRCARLVARGLQSGQRPARVGGDVVRGTVASSCRAFAGATPRRTSRRTSTAIPAFTAGRWPSARSRAIPDMCRSGISRQQRASGWHGGIEPIVDRKQFKLSWIKPQEWRSSS